MHKNDAFRNQQVEFVNNYPYSCFFYGYNSTTPSVLFNSVFRV